MQIPVVVLIFLATATATATATAQWQLQESHSKASFRGVHSLGSGVAWVSGTEGTVLRTEDGGVTWQHCAVPPGAEKLDFRGVQGFDAKTAIVMSSGKGDFSRLYKTTDGCQTWKLVFTNPDKDGFWDAITLNPNDADGFIVGDPVANEFVYLETEDQGETWKRVHAKGLESRPGEGLFAASNSSLYLDERFWLVFGTGSIAEPRVLLLGDDEKFSSKTVPIRGGSAGAGIFSVFAKEWCCLVAVGGDYERPNEPLSTAAYTLDEGKHWQASETFPHGYRSAVAYDPKSKTWITVGPNGTDASTDDGRNWHALKPGPNDAPDADRNWNALSLPFVVGPHGRIGVLRAAALSAKP